jgi:hypothetical protein
MREICLYGSERGALGNQRPYRDHQDRGMPRRGGARAEIGTRRQQ